MKIYICHIYSKYRFIEYIRSVANKLDIQKEFYYNDISQLNDLDFATDKFIIAQKIPFEDKRFTPHNTQIINTEQLTRIEWKNRISKYIEKGFKVYSYSLSDIIQDIFSHNQITFINIILRIYILYMFLINKYNKLEILYLLSAILNCLNGFTARKYNMETKIGDYMDHISDVIFNIILGYLVLLKLQKI